MIQHTHNCDVQSPKLCYVLITRIADDHCEVQPAVCARIIEDGQARTHFDAKTILCTEYTTVGSGTKGKNEQEQRESRVRKYY